MPKERADERAARWIVSQVLGCPVERFEDGLQDSQVDGQILLPSGPAGLEIVSDRDPEFSSQWSALNKVNHRVTVPGLERRWIVSVSRTAKIKQVVRQLPSIMLQLQHGQISRGRFSRVEELEPFGITYAAPIEQDDTPGGVVHLTVEGWCDVVGESLTPWLDDMFTRHEDVVHKLATHPTPDGHAFLWATSSTDFAVQFALEDRGQDVPVDVPNLPAGVTHVWIAGTPTSQGALAWFPDKGWWRTPWRWPAVGPLELPDGF